LHLLCHRLGPLDVAGLRALVAAAQQQQDRRAASAEIDAVAAALVDPELRHAAADRPSVAGIALGQSVDAPGDAAACFAILQIRHPGEERGGLDDLKHRRIVIYSLRTINQFPAGGDTLRGVRERHVCAGCRSKGAAILTAIDSVRP
jgi:hypothetical protein